MFLLIKQKWGNFFHLTLNGSWGIGFWNSVKFSNVFAPAETVIFRLLFGDFWPNSPKCCQFCLKFWPVMTCKMMQHICYSFYWNNKKWSKLCQKTDFWGNFERFFVYVLLHPMNYVPRFYQWKDLIKIHICRESFISIAYVVVKSKIFKVFQIEAAFWSGSFWGGSSIKYRISNIESPRSQKKDRILVKLSKKNLGGAKIRSKLSLGAAPNSHIAYNSTIHIFFLHPSILFDFT